MKKFLFSLIAMIMMAVSAISFASCSDDDDNQVTCNYGFSLQTNGDLSDQDAGSVSLVLGTLNAKAIEAVGTADVLLDAEDVNGTLAPKNDAIAKVQQSVMSSSTVQGYITDLKNLKNSDGKELVSHLNFDVFSTDKKTCYYSNSIF